MKISKSRTSIIRIFLVITIILLGSNIFFEKYYDHIKLTSAKGLPSNLINKRFQAALSNYKIDSSWIESKDLSDYEDDSLKYFYNVKVPADLPVSLLIKEIINQFDTNEVNIYASDNRTESSVEIKIFSAKFLKLAANIKNNNLLHRQADSIAFLITGIENLNHKELNDLMMMPEQFTCILIPSKHAIDLSKQLSQEQKQTAVLLNDDIGELEFKLKAGYSRNRIKNSLKSIGGTFNSASFFIIDERADIYNSEHYDAIKNWFGRKGLFPENKFKEIEFSSPENTFTLIRNGQSKEKIYQISADDFLKMSPVFASLRKLGYRIVYPSVLIKTSI